MRTAGKFRGESWPFQHETVIGSLRTTGKEQGAMLIIIIITMVIVAMLGVGMLYLNTSATYSQLLANNQARAYWLAQSGIEYAVPIIINANNNQQTTPITGLNNQTFTLSDGSRFYLRTDNTDAACTIVESTGIVNQNGPWQAMQKMAFRIGKNSTRFTVAALAEADMILEGTGYVDTYDSRLAPWTFATHGVDGAIQTISTASGKLHLKGQSDVYGDLIVGVGGNPATVAVVDSGAAYTGTKYAATSAVATPSISMPTGGTAVTIQHGDNLSTGTYRTNDLKLDHSDLVSVSGHVVIYVTHDFTMQDTSEIDILPGGSLTVIVAHNINLQGKGVDTRSVNPSDFTIYGTSGCPSVQLKKGINFYGTIYAPDAAVVISGDSDLFGAVVGKTVDVKDRGSIHYDKALQAGALVSFVKY
jgi:Tfp pilus assembly protein PilX